MSDQTPRDILKALGEPFPREAIKSRQGGGGKQFSYVETHAVIHRLNSATNGEWDFRIVNVEWRADLLIVQGELTIPGLGTRSGFGVQKVAPNAGEDLVKGGASDSLKKCATLFGVALELYGIDYEGYIPQIQPTSRTAPQNVSQPLTDTFTAQTVTPQNAPQPDHVFASTTSEALATERQSNLIKALTRDLKISDTALDGRCMERFGVPFVGLTRQHASTIIESLKDAQKARKGVVA